MNKKEVSYEELEKMAMEIKSIFRQDADIGYSIDTEKLFSDGARLEIAAMLVNATYEPKLINFFWDKYRNWRKNKDEAELMAKRKIMEEEIRSMIKKSQTNVENEVIASAAEEIYKGISPYLKSYLK